MILAPRPKFYEHGSNTAGSYPEVRTALCSFFFLRFSGRLSIGIAILTPLKGGNARQFFVGCFPVEIL